MSDSEKISTFLNFARDAKNEYQQCHKRQKELEVETQDILHTIEMKPLSATQMVRAYKTLRRVRQERRAIKDKAVVLDAFIKWADENHMALKSLEQALGSVRKQERYVNERQYIFKTEVCKEFGVNEGAIF